MPLLGLPRQRQRHFSIQLGILLFLCCITIILAAISTSNAAAHDDANLSSRGTIKVADLVKPPSAKTNVPARGLEKYGSGGRSRTITPSRPTTPSDLILSDTLILTSVEGGLYAIDRGTGERLWTLPPQTGHQSDSLLRPLVTALYGKEQKSFVEIAKGLGRSFSSTFGLGSMDELQAGGIYIVEPSSAGDIYVLTASKGDEDDGALGLDGQGGPGHVKLDKLPLTIPQLVELSPFSFAGDDSRVFVGQKQTTLVELDVRTGKLGAVFGGRAGGVWCGAHAQDPAQQVNGKDEGAGSLEAEACIDDEGAFGAASQSSEWAYVGRTDYTLKIHSRSNPEHLQTLHFSTFSPNAGDRDIQSIWYRANHPDGRAVMGMPEDGSVVCFNLSTAETSSESSEQEDQGEKTIWTTDLEASVAGIFDIVYPAPHLQNTKSMSRPVLVSHLPVPLSQLFPQIGVGQDAEGGLPRLEGERKTRRSAYLGIASDSLFTMSGNRFPLVAFTSKAMAGLPAGQDESSSGLDSALLPSTGNWANEKKCASFGCWLGSYSLEVDASAEGALQESLLGSNHLLEIDDGRDGWPRFVIGDRPSNTDNSSVTDDEEDNQDDDDEDPLTGAPSSSPRKSRTSPRRTLRSKSQGKLPKRTNEDDTAESEASSGSDASSQSSWRPWKSRLAIVLLQLIGVLLIGLLTGAAYLGLQNQQSQTEAQAAAIAEGVVWVPALKEDEADFSLVGADGEKIRLEEERQLNEAIERSKVEQPSTQLSNGSSDSAAAASGSANGNADGEGDAEAAAKKKENKRRRRGKRAGALAAAKAAKAAKGEEDDGEEDDDGDEGEAAEKPDALGIENGGRNRSSSVLTVADSGVAMEENDTPKKRKPAAESAPRKAAAKGAPISLVVPSKGSPQLTQALISPKPNSSFLEAGWPSVADADDQDEAMIAAGEHAAKIAAGATTSSPTNGMKGTSLTISDEVLGYGSSGTVVFKGTFQGRAVAVKRLLRDFVNVASKEVQLLESADNHPNVIRYFYKELTPSFLFIALELCPASLADVVERPNDYRELSVLLDPKRALSQITSGLRHLHSLSIVHRDIKPQNILVSTSSSGRALKMLLSDFGLSKKLDGLAQTSFSQTMNNPGGTVGWRAPEILRGDINLDAGSESESSMGNNSSSSRGGGKEEKQRLTRAVDIFALGCTAYYVLLNGDHPFGSRFEREMNIIRRRVDTSRLDGLGEEGHEAQDLVLQMVDHDPRQRPSANEILTHPYFWDPNKRLNFLQDASDRFEIMEKDPPTPALVLLEAKAFKVVGTDWHRRCDRAFLENLGKFRKYNPASVQDLLRAMRNKKHHYQDMPTHLKRMLGPIPDGFLGYFTRRFPELFLHVHRVIVDQPLIRNEPMFREYFVCLEQDH